MLWVLTAALVSAGIAGLVSSRSGGLASHAGAGYLFLVALFTGSGARAVASGGQPAAGDHQPPAAGSLPRTGPEPQADTRPRAGAGPQTAEPPLAEGDPHPARIADGHPAQRPGTPGGPLVRYTERAANLPVYGAVAGVALLAAGLAGLVAVGGPNGRGAGASGVIFLLLALGSAVYLLFVLIDLPNGILIGDGRFAVGVAGVPPAGRLWRRIEGPLDAVRNWEVLSAEQARGLRQQRAAERRAARNRASQPRASQPRASQPRASQPRQYLGDLRLFGRRGVLRLRVDQAAVRASLPSRILAGYAFVDAAAAGAVWDGTVIIGTRRGPALAAALDQALPGRRASG